jgi:CubicO group peptidase (beta-lactamase class C family)
MIRFKDIMKGAIDADPNTVLNDFIKTYKISSYVCYVFKRGRPVFYRNSNADMNSVFGLGSVSKSIDKIAVLKLVEMGRIKLSDPILQFGFDVPKDGVNMVNYYDWDGWGSITVEHLLRHKSGIPDMINDIPDFNVHYGELGQEADPDDLTILRAVSKYPLKYEPGQDTNYSNTNFWLIGKIIERITGKPYGDAMRELIFDPLGMSNTYWAYESTNPPNLVNSYVLDQETNRLIRKFPIKPFDAWAIFYSTPKDMQKLAQALLKGRIISRITRDSFFDSEDDTPGQLGAIHDGFQCYWDVVIDKDSYYLLMVNVFGQSLIDPMVDTVNKITKTVLTDEHSL